MQKYDILDLFVLCLDNSATAAQRAGSASSLRRPPPSNQFSKFSLKATVVLK